jgi:hypothetical protein
MDVSIVMPGIRTYRWWDVYTQLGICCSEHSWELIIVTPSRDLPSEFKDVSNVKHVQDHGTPSRALQLGTTHADGEYLTWITDDGIPMYNCIDNSLEGLKTMRDIDVVCMRYDEGPSYAMDRQHDMRYWKASTHKDMHLDGVNQEWFLPMIMLLRTDFYRRMGGIDCRFEHTNFNLIDLGFRVQRYGSTVYFSMSTYLKVNGVMSRRNPNNSAVIAASDSDRKLFMSIYSTKETADARPTTIAYDNWKDSPEVWDRRQSIPSEPE